MFVAGRGQLNLILPQQISGNINSVFPRFTPIIGSDVFNGALLTTEYSLFYLSVWEGKLLNFLCFLSIFRENQIRGGILCFTETVSTTTHLRCNPF